MKRDRSLLRRKNGATLTDTGSESQIATARSECGTVPMFRLTDLEISLTGMQIWTYAACAASSSHGGGGGRRNGGDVASLERHLRSPIVKVRSHVRVHDSKYVDPRRSVGRPASL